MLVYRLCEDKIDTRNRKILNLIQRLWNIQWKGFMN